MLKLRFRLPRHTIQDCFQPWFWKQILLCLFHMKNKTNWIHFLCSLSFLASFISTSPLWGQAGSSTISDSYVQALQQTLSKINSIQLKALITAQVDPLIAAQADVVPTITRSITYVGDNHGRYFYDINYLNSAQMDTKGYTIAFNGKMGQFLEKDSRPLLAISKRDGGGGIMLSGANPLLEPLEFLCADCNGNDPKMIKSNSLGIIMDINNLLKRLSSAKLLEDHRSWYFAGGIFNGVPCDFIVHFDPQHAFPSEVERIDPKTKKKFTDWTVSQWGTISNEGIVFEYPKSAQEKVFGPDGKQGALMTLNVESFKFNEPVGDNDFIISPSQASRIYDSDSHLFLNK